MKGQVGEWLWHQGYRLQVLCFIFRTDHNMLWLSTGGNRACAESRHCGRGASKSVRRLFVIPVWHPANPWPWMWTSSIASKFSNPSEAIQNTGMRNKMMWLENTEDWAVLPATQLILAPAISLVGSDFSNMTGKMNVSHRAVCFWANLLQHKPRLLQSVPP